MSPKRKRPTVPGRTFLDTGLRASIRRLKRDLGWTGLLTKEALDCYKANYRLPLDEKMAMLREPWPESVAEYCAQTRRRIALTRPS